MYGSTGNDAYDLDFTGDVKTMWSSGLLDTPNREYHPNQGRWISPDPAGAGWNLYAYVLNNPLSYIDPSGLECMWDDGGYDAENDSVTGNVSGCDSAGGTWVELGQNGNWSNQADAANAQLASDIQNGLVGSVNIIGADGLTYSTFYNGAGQVTATVTPSGTMVFSYASFLDVATSNINAIRSLIQNGVNYLKTHPVFISANEILAGQVTVQWSTKTVCANLGAGASVPPTKALTVGALNGGDMAQWTNVQSSWGYSFGANLGLGYQGSFNSSGKIGGPTISGVGLSGSYTFGGCTTVP
jgi:RHS repeat-associated protein